MRARPGANEKPRRSAARASRSREIPHAAGSTAGWAPSNSQRRRPSYTVSPAGQRLKRSPAAVGAAQGVGRHKKTPPGRALPAAMSASLRIRSASPPGTDLQGGVARAPMVDALASALVTPWSTPSTFAAPAAASSSVSRSGCRRSWSRKRSAAGSGTGVSELIFTRKSCNLQRTFWIVSAICCPRRVFRK